ncbi:hypothetical protein E2562_019648 [Oryza meyeriana var. granulata]|uniref:Uncharacterized protein n=1 Tax=Oryza meyeriana var. granulata TaxID=110450 RepID=A0A6G1C689_9ORYZ|nr:hypothetical protein E2562_019648 [Oryza meyeriana var. granulata]
MKNKSELSTTVLQYRKGEQDKSAKKRIACKPACKGEGTRRAPTAAEAREQDARRRRWSRGSRTNQAVGNLTGACEQVRRLARLAKVDCRNQTGPQIGDGSGDRCSGRQDRRRRSKRQRRTIAVVVVEGGGRRMRMPRGRHE